MKDKILTKDLLIEELERENQKLKDINKQLMKEIQWENRLNSKLSKELEGYKKKVIEVVDRFFNYYVITNKSGCKINYLVGEELKQKLKEQNNETRNNI